MSRECHLNSNRRRQTGSPVNWETGFLIRTSRARSSSLTFSPSPLPPSRLRSPLKCFNISLVIFFPQGERTSVVMRVVFDSQAHYPDGHASSELRKVGCKARRCPLPCLPRPNPFHETWKGIRVDGCYCNFYDNNGGGYTTVQ